MLSMITSPAPSIAFAIRSLLLHHKVRHSASKAIPRSRSHSRTQTNADINETDELRLHENVFVYDKFRNVNGRCIHNDLQDIIRNFGNYYCS